MTELIKKCKAYVEYLITLSCGDMSDYKFDEAYSTHIEGQLHGNNCVMCGESVNKDWAKIPSPDFDKDSAVYYYCGRRYGRWRILNAVSSTHPDALIIVSYTHK